MAASLRQAGLDQEPGPVLHQGTADEAQPCLHSESLTVELRVQVCRARMLASERFSPRKSASRLRPSPGGEGPSSQSSFGRKLFIDAQVSSVRSTLKWSLDKSRFTRGSRACLRRTASFPAVSSAWIRGARWCPARPRGLTGLASAAPRRHPPSLDQRARTLQTQTVTLHPGRVRQGNSSWTASGPAATAGV